MSYIIALDIGGTNCRVALVNASYQIEAIHVVDTIVGDKEAFLEQVAQAILRFEHHFPIVLALSMGVPGRVDSKEEIAILPNIKITDVPLKAYLTKRFNKPVFIRNDAVMAALAEANLGYGKSFSSTYFMTISTGIGGAFVRDHQLAFSSEEIGHMMIPYKHNWMELEQRGSGTGIVKLAAEHGLSIDSSKSFWQLVAQQRPETKPVYNAWLSIMKQTLTFIDRYFQPDVYVFSGGVVRNEAYFFQDFKALFPHRRLELAQLGQDAGILGAAYLGFSLTLSPQAL